MRRSVRLPASPPRVLFDAGRKTTVLAARFTGREMDFACSDGDDAGRFKVDVSAGKGDNASPMHLLLYAVSTCAMADMVIILNKQRVQDLELNCRIEAQRSEATDARPFEKIHMHFQAACSGGALTQSKFERAVELSVDKYCGVHATLHGGPATISYSGEVVEKHQ